MTWRSLLVCIGLPAKDVRLEIGHLCLADEISMCMYICMCYCFTVSALCFVLVMSDVLLIIIRIPGQNIAYWWRWIWLETMIHGSYFFCKGMNSESSLSLYLWDTHSYSLNCLLLPIVLPPQGVWIFDRSFVLCTRSIYIVEIDCVDHVHPHLNALLLPCLAHAVAMEAL